MEVDNGRLGFRCPPRPSTSTFSPALPETLAAMLEAKTGEHASRMTAMTAAGHSREGIIIRSIPLFAVLIYELFGPLFTKIALDKAGEIKEKPVPPRKKAALEAKAGKSKKPTSNIKSPQRNVNVTFIKSCCCLN